MHYNEHEVFTYVINHLHRGPYSHSNPAFNNLSVCSNYSAEAIRICTDCDRSFAETNVSCRWKDSWYQRTRRNPRNHMNGSRYRRIEHSPKLEQRQIYERAANQVHLHYFMLPQSMYASLFRNMDISCNFSWNVDNNPEYMLDVFSHFLTPNIRKDFLCIGSGSGYINFVAGYILKKGGINHGLEIAENLFKECQMRARDIECNLPTLQTHTTFPTFFKNPDRLFGRKVKYDCILCNRCVTLEDAWWIASHLSEDGVMLCPYVIDGDQVTTMFFSKTMKVRAKKINYLPSLMRQRSLGKGDLVPLDLRSKEVDDLSTLCLESISESLRRHFLQENLSDEKNQCIHIRLDWGWNLYMKHKWWFDEFFSKTKQSITLTYTLLLRVTESEVVECLKSSKALTQVLDHIECLQHTPAVTLRDVVTPNRYLDLPRANYFWFSSLGFALSSTLTFLQAAAVKPDFWSSLKRELDRFITDEQETSYIPSNIHYKTPQSHNIEVSLGLIRAVHLHLYQLLERHLKFLTNHRTNESIALSRGDGDNFDEIIKEFKSNLFEIKEYLQVNPTRSYVPVNIPRVIKIHLELNRRIEMIVLKVKLRNDCFQSAIQNSLDDTLRFEMESMMFELKLLDHLQKRLNYHIEDLLHRFTRDSVNTESYLDTKNIAIIIHLFSPRDNDCVSWSQNIPRLALIWLRQISSIMSQDYNVKENGTHRYYRFLDENASKLFPRGLRKSLLAQLREL